jgi:glutamate formiminotransferase/formiminotetrahydrofolate cyclodeaminase
MLIDLTLAQFAEQTAARSPTPGGGSVAAYLGQLGAALGAMAARFTQGRKGFEAHESALAAEIARLDALRGRLQQLVDDDAQSYDKVTAAYGLPKGTDAEKAARQPAIARALQDAMQAPLGTCRLAVEALGVLDGLRQHVNRNLASDVAVGAYALGACFRGAWINVLINLGGLRDEALTARVRAEGEELGARAQELEQRIGAAILADLRG